MSDLDQRLAAAGQGRNAPGGAVTQTCQGRSCSQLWREVMAEKDRTLAIKDPIARNRQISAQYAALYEADHDLQWVGLAGIVSRQAGCAMVKAKDASGSWIGWKAQPAGAAYRALAEANGTIYGDIYPAASFYRRNGLARLKECSSAADGHQVDPKLVAAFEQIDRGTPESIKRGSDMIANYEQRDIIQEQVYAREEYRRAFAENEKWTQGWRAPIGGMMGAEKPELPLATTCTEAGKLPFDGSILDPNARVAYYEKLSRAYGGLSQPQRDAMAQDLLRQAGR